MFTIGKHKFNRPLILAPMEDITDQAFRQICIELGADFVFTEFVNCEGLIRSDEKTHKKMALLENERPAGIQIYGERLEALVEGAKLANKLNPDLLDLNAGCWVKKVSGRGAGAGLLKDPDYLEQIVREIVKVSDVSVSVKTRIGWDEKSINILEVSQRIQDAGAKLLTLHCRPRSQGHSGEPQWEWIDRVKEKLEIPVILNGGLMTAEDIKRASETTSADGFMIARGAVAHPWIFKESKDLLNDGSYDHINSYARKIDTAIKHLKISITLKEERRAVIEFRKFYSGYLKGLYNASKIRNELMKFHTFVEIEKILLDYKEQLYLHNVKEENKQKD